MKSQKMMTMSDDEVVAACNVPRGTYLFFFSFFLCFFLPSFPLSPFFIIRSLDFFCKAGSPFFPALEAYGNLIETALRSVCFSIVQQRECHYPTLTEMTYLRYLSRHNLSLFSNQVHSLSLFIC